MKSVVIPAPVFTRINSGRNPRINSADWIPAFAGMITEKASCKYNMKKIELPFNLVIEMIKQQKRFVVYSPALDISTCAKSKKEAISRFIELTNIFLDESAKIRTIYGN